MTHYMLAPLAQPDIYVLTRVRICLAGNLCLSLEADAPVELDVEAPAGVVELRRVGRKRW